MLDTNTIFTKDQPRKEMFWNRKYVFLFC